MKMTCLFQTFPNSGKIRITVSVVNREERKNTMLKNNYLELGDDSESGSLSSLPPVQGARRHPCDRSSAVAYSLESC